MYYALIKFIGFYVTAAKYKTCASDLSIFNLILLYIITTFKCKVFLTNKNCIQN